METIRRFCRCSIILMMLVAVVVSESAYAVVERYKTEPEYLARLSELGHSTVVEGFESSDWDAVRSAFPSIISMPSVTSQGLTWEAAAKSLFGSYSSKVHGVTTNNNWARSGLWGIYEDHVGEPYPTTIRLTATVPMYGVGGWFNTNPDGQSVGFLFEDATTANDPGYLLPGFGAMYPGDNPAFGHEFVGIVDPDGFYSVVLTGTLEINEEGVLEGGTIFGADDFTIGIAPTLTADFDNDNDVDAADLAIWEGALGLTDAGDTDLDNDSDGLDFLAWQLEFIGPNAPLIAKVPEPSSSVLLCLFALAVLPGLRASH